MAKYIFKISPLPKILCSFVEPYTLESKHCIDNLLLFASTCHCEQDFSTMCMMRTKFCETLENDSVSLSETVLRIYLHVEKR